MTTLYQFSFSHFCEKARWAIDYKEETYTIKNLLPGPHLNVTKKLAPKTCVPQTGTCALSHTRNFVIVICRESMNGSFPPVT